MSNPYRIGGSGGESHARESVRATIGQDPFELLEELREAGRRKAKAEGLAYQLEEQRKIVLCSIQNELSVVHAREKLSEAKLERMARADPRYEAHIRGTAAAIEEREAASAAYWALQSDLQWCEKTLAHANAMSRLEGYR
jgi:hypothetical protein